SPRMATRASSSPRTSPAATTITSSARSAARSRTSPRTRSWRRRWLRPSTKCNAPPDSALSTTASTWSVAAAPAPESERSVHGELAAERGLVDVARAGADRDPPFAGEGQLHSRGDPVPRTEPQELDLLGRNLLARKVDRCRRLERLEGGLGTGAQGVEMH